MGYTARSYYLQTIQGRSLDSEKNIPSPWFICIAVPNPIKCNKGLTYPETFRLLERGSLSPVKYPTISFCKFVEAEQLASVSVFKRSSALDPNNIDDVKGEITRGQPVLFGVHIDKKF